MTNWYPAAIQDPGNDAGAYTDTGEPKGLLHTTEGKTYLSAKGAYINKNAWPHFTATYEKGFFQIYQHNPISVASRALLNESGGVQTNRDNVVQIELVGTANRHNAATWGQQYVENFPPQYLDGIGRWMRWVEAQRGIPRLCNVVFIKYPESYGNNSVRLTGPEWDAYSGWLGHQHAPENTHGDPGLINMAYLLGVDVPIPPISVEDNDMPFIVTNPSGASLLVASDLSRAAGMTATSRKAYMEQGKMTNTLLTHDEFDRYEKLPRI